MQTTETMTADQIVEYLRTGLAELVPNIPATVELIGETIHIKAVEA